MYSLLIHLFHILFVCVFEQQQLILLQGKPYL